MSSSAENKKKAEEDRTISIIVVDDHKLFRRGVISLLHHEPDLTVVGECENGGQAVQMSRELLPDVVLMDISLPELNGMEATRQITGAAPDIRVIALSMHDGEEYVQQMMTAGATGYVLKSAGVKTLVDAIHSVSRGNSFLCPNIAGIVIDGYLRNKACGGSPAQLTYREREVLKCLAGGYSTKQIAETLQVAPKTVESHRRQIMQKLNIFSVAQLTKYALREGLTTLEF